MKLRIIAALFVVAVLANLTVLRSANASGDIVGEIAAAGGCACCG